MGTTSTFLKSRVSKPTVGKWSSGFSEVKKYAEDNNVPIIGVWSNGDKCGYCTNFENTVMNSAFMKWMASSGCVFWFGCSSDKTTDDKHGGTGYTWTKNKKLSTFPFVRVWWNGGKVDDCRSGNAWTGGGTKGYDKFISELEKLLGGFKPGNGCPSGGCVDSSSDTKKKVSELRGEFENFKTSFEKKLKEVEKKV